MDSKILNEKTIRITLYIIGAISILMVLYTAFLFHFRLEILAWVQQLLSTLFAASLALLFALYVYLKQVEDDKSRVRKLLRSYLKYLSSQVKTAPEKDRVSISQVNTNLIDQIILSGHVQDVAPRLIILQAFIDQYVKFGDASIMLVHENNGIVPAWMKLNIDSNAKIILKEVERCEQIMDGEAIVNEGGAMTFVNKGNSTDE